MATKINDLAAGTRLMQVYGPLTIADPNIETDEVDCLDGDGPAFAIVSLRADSGSASLTGTIEASANGNDWSSVAGGALAIASGAAVDCITFPRPLRYLRAAVSVENDDNPYSLSVLLGQARKLT